MPTCGLMAQMWRYHCQTTLCTFGEDMIKPQTPPPSEPPDTPLLFANKQEMLFDFFDKFGGLSGSEKLQAAFHTGFPHKMALLGSWGTLLFGWLYLAYVGLINPAIVLLLVLMLMLHGAHSSFRSCRKQKKSPAAQHVWPTTPSVCDLRDSRIALWAMRLLLRCAG